MRVADLPGLVTSSMAAFGDLRRRLSQPDPPARRTGGPSVGEGIVRQLLDSDAAGAWCVTDGDEVVGVALAGLRERLWFLAQLHVAPTYQGAGLGRRLLEAALGYGAGAAGMLLHSSLDPQAMRCYQRAGFALEPALQATGRVRRDAVPALSGVREGDRGDLDLIADLDRLQRGGPHGPDLDVLLRFDARLLVLDDGPRRGYALIDDGPRILTATDVRSAATLLWAALAESGDGDVALAILRADQQWAVDVAVTAGLRLGPTGPLCRRGNPGPLAPYLPHNALL